jgi:site-specific recombinase XerD
MNASIDRFLSYCLHERQFSKHTTMSYQHDLIAYFKFLHSQDTIFTAVDKPIARVYLLALHQQPLSVRSINRHLATLRHFYAYYVRLGEMSVNPFKLIETPKQPFTLPTPAPSQDVDALLIQHASSPSIIRYRDMAMILLMYTSGLRVSEVSQLTLQDCDVARRMLRVVGKGDKERLVPMTEQTQTMLHHYLKMVRPQLLSKSKRKVSTHVFLNLYKSPSILMGFSIVDG